MLTSRSSCSPGVRFRNRPRARPYAPPPPAGCRGADRRRRGVGSDRFCMARGDGECSRLPRWWRVCLSARSRQRCRWTDAARGNRANGPEPLPMTRRGRDYRLWQEFSASGQARRIGELGPSLKFSPRSRGSGDARNISSVLDAQREIFPWPPHRGISYGMDVSTAGMSIAIDRKRAHAGAGFFAARGSLLASAAGRSSRAPGNGSCSPTSIRGCSTTCKDGGRVTSAWRV